MNGEYVKSFAETHKERRRLRDPTAGGFQPVYRASSDLGRPTSPAQEGKELRLLAPVVGADAPVPTVLDLY